MYYGWKTSKNKNEIAIDRMYADNNNYQVGQTIKVGKKKLKLLDLWLYQIIVLSFQKTVI